jgi:integrase
MATITKRKNRYTAVVRRAGYPTTTKTFGLKTDAKRWAAAVESDIDSGRVLNVQKYHRNDETVGGLVERFIAEVHPMKQFGGSKLATLQLTARELNDVKVARFKSKDVIEYGRRRREVVSKSTLNQQLQYLSQVLEYARIVWEVPMNGNPVKDGRYALSKTGLVGSSNKRGRRLRVGEYERLIDAAAGHWITYYITIARDNTMRLGEIHNQRWKDVNFDEQTLTIRDRKDPNQKEGNDETIPMIGHTYEVLRGLWAVSTRKGRVFSMVKNAGSVSDKFAAVTQAAGIDDLHFHDLRHEAISRLFERGLQIQEVALVSGHKSWDSLKRYTQLKPGQIIEALAS